MRGRRVCFSEDEVLAWLSGTMVAAERDAVDAHLDACASCRALVAALGASGSSRRDHTGPTFAPGDELAGRYRVVRFLARGGMGEVYEAIDLALGEGVAIKTVGAHVADDPAFVSRLKREVQLARRVSHENVCRIFDWVSHARGDSEVSFLTMELLSGETLADQLARSGPLPWSEALPIAKQIAAGLDAAHRAGVVHRDLKPSNVFLTASRAVVTDFGLARAGGEAPQLRDASSPQSSPVVTHGAIGTPRYMAPEQARGDVVTTAADIYAFGLLLRELVAAPPLWLVTAIARCLASNPAARPPTAGDALGGSRRGWRRRVVAALAGVAVIAAAAVVVTYKPSRSTTRALVAECTPPSASSERLYVDADRGVDDERHGSSACPLRTITAALARAAERTDPLEISVGPGRYDQALGEQFPLVARGPVHVVGSGQLRTLIVGTGSYATESTAFAHPVPVTIVAGNLDAPIELAELGIAPDPSTGTLGGIAVLCDRGPLHDDLNVGPHPPPSLTLRAVAIGPNFDPAVVVAGTLTRRGCSLRIEDSLIHDAGLGVWTVGCGANDHADRTAVALSVAKTQFFAIRAPQEPYGMAISAWDCTGWLTVTDSEFARGDLGIALVNHPPAFTHANFVHNSFHDLTRVGIAVGRAARVENLTDNSFVHNTGGTVRAVADRAIGFMLDTGAETNGTPEVLRARGNLFFDNDVGLEVHGSTPMSAAIDFGRTDDPGRNVFRCNAALAGSPVGGHDVVIRVDGKDHGRLLMNGNTWDHAPPTTALAIDGSDVVRERGTLTAELGQPHADTAMCSMRRP